MRERVTEFFGWYGVVAIVSAYALTNFEIVAVQSLTYQLLNATGAIGIMVDAWQDKNFQPVVLNVLWLVIAVVSIVRSV